MRIDAYNQVAKIYQTAPAKPIAGKSGKTENLKDALQLSQTGRDMQIAKQAVNDAPDVREDRISQIKAQLASGTYNVTGQEFAEKLVSSYSNGITMGENNWRV